MRAAFITAFGGAENIAISDVGQPTPRSGTIVVQVEAAGLNYYDIVERYGNFPDQPQPPLRAGVEGAGTVVAVGPDVSEAAVSDRVMWMHVPGSHAQFVEVPAAEAIPLPDWLAFSDAAAVCVQGLTAHYLANSVRTADAGDTALVWAAAGGVGRLLTQMLTAKGVRVIAATSNDAKAQAARDAGAVSAVPYSDVKAAVEDLTAGVGVDVVYDGVGAPTFEAGLASVRSRGLLAVYGGAGGRLQPVDPWLLAAAGSVQFTRTRLHDFTATREELLNRAGEVIAAIQSGEITVRIEATYPLDDISDAHRALESRSTIGKIIVVP